MDAAAAVVEYRLKAFHLRPKPVIRLVSERMLRIWDCHREGFLRQKSKESGFMIDMYSLRKPTATVRSLPSAFNQGQRSTNGNTPLLNRGINIWNRLLTWAMLAASKACEERIFTDRLDNLNQRRSPPHIDTFVYWHHSQQSKTKDIYIHKNFNQRRLLSPPVSLHKSLQELYIVYA